jgi:hypothetical protein
MRRTLALAALSASAASAYTPAFLWSEKLDAGVGRAAEHLGEVSAHELARTVASIVDKGGAAAASPLLHTPPTVHPEVQLVFAVAGLETEAVRAHAASLPQIERLVRTSESSVSMPFTAGAPRGGSVFDTATRVASHDAESYLNAHPELFANDVPDVVLIELPSASGHSPADALRAQDKFVGKISGMVSRATGGKYAALVASANAVLGGRRRLEEEMPEPLHATPELWTALAVSLYLIVIFLSGFCCLFSLQTPRKFDDASKATHAS